MAATIPDDRLEGAIARVLSESPVKAAAFIVTIYGDVVEPRGGVVWIGNLIETCATVGISETLVRTAVSRLVAAGQLTGERDGRRSYYRLSPSARAEYAAASGVLFGPPEAEDWHFVHAAGAGADEEMQALQRAGYARVGARMAAGPRKPPPLGPGAMVWRAEGRDGATALRAFAVDNWDLAPHASAYAAFVAQFGPVAEALQGNGPPPAPCLTARLLLVHRFRAVALRDPRLPERALPADWPGISARRLFAALYRALSPGADRQVGERFLSTAGPLAPATDTTRRRLAMLSAAAGSGSEAPDRET